MDLGLQGKRALVTGSSGGVGAAVAQRLAAEGCVIVIHGRHADTAQTQVEAIRSAGGPRPLS
jgi:3-oxoacyl-[acyl-carrier protein] reductase